jgi:hypothetical protein
MESGNKIKKAGNFKSKARHHQSQYRADILRVDYDEYANMLTMEDAKRGLNFYSDFNILQSVYDRYGEKYSKQLYANLLRSEHVPFNLFIPLLYDLELAKKVFNEILDDSIQEIEDIKIEYAPSPADKYLNDRTSFDAYVRYKHIDGQIGILGIEVKYTEGSYPLKKDSKEETDILNKKSRYWEVSEKSGVFHSGYEIFVLDEYRQIWRNHLLGECIKQVDKISHFTSLTFYPQGNIHFSLVIPQYRAYLKDPNRVIGVTYEDFIGGLKKYSTGQRYDRWIKYLEDRYLID